MFFFSFAEFVVYFFFCVFWPKKYGNNTTWQISRPLCFFILQFIVKRKEKEKEKNNRIAVTVRKTEVIFMRPKCYSVLHFFFLFALCSSTYIFCTGVQRYSIALDDSNVVVVAFKLHFTFLPLYIYLYFFYPHTQRWVHRCRLTRFDPLLRVRDTLHMIIFEVAKT